MKRLCAILGGVFFLVMTVSAHAADLYAATASGGPGQLYLLNAATGAVLDDIGPLNDIAGTNYPMTGLAFHPATGVLYGSTANNPASTAARLVRINPATGLVTVIGAFNAGNPGNPATMADLAFDATGKLYGVGSVGGPQLYSIDLLTGQATVIGNTGLTSTSGGGLDIGPDGTIYGTPTASRYGTYDASGAYTNITNPTKPAGGGAYNALAFDGGVLYGVNSGPGSPPPTHLVTIDPATGAVTDIGASVDALDAIAFVVPEPSMMTLLAASACVTTLRARRSQRRRR